MNAQPTGAPWTARHIVTQDGKGGSQRYEIRAGKDLSIKIADMPGWDEDDEANALLVAAAPDMLESINALEDCLGTLFESGRVDFSQREDAPIIQGILDNARAAIAKARGAA